MARIRISVARIIGTSTTSGIFSIFLCFFVFLYILFLYNFKNFRFWYKLHQLIKSRKWLKLGYLTLYEYHSLLCIAIDKHIYLLTFFISSYTSKFSLSNKLSFSSDKIESFNFHNKNYAYLYTVFIYRIHEEID